MEKCCNHTHRLIYKLMNETSFLTLNKEILPTLSVSPVSVSPDNKEKLEKVDMDMTVYFRSSNVSNSSRPPASSCCPSLPPSVGAGLSSGRSFSSSSSLDLIHRRGGEETRRDLPRKQLIQTPDQTRCVLLQHVLLSVSEV